ncbi:unnamed protein product [Toxocara canis]|uniref:Ovule protein n=1 Tax=Toxocara canis TaxID=6265 RepID=A0A183UYR5_TOXCA|nr:unnamed protein product [Toxocara canis]
MSEREKTENEMPKCAHTKRKDQYCKWRIELRIEVLTFLSTTPNVTPIMVCPGFSNANGQLMGVLEEYAFQCAHWTCYI